jgi:hypothetical protein
MSFYSRIKHFLCITFGFLNDTYNTFCDVRLNIRVNFPVIKFKDKDIIYKMVYAFILDTFFLKKRSLYRFKIPKMSTYLNNL